MAKIVALLKKPGDRIELDDALCEVETDKAVYPIESSFAGTMGEWKTEVDATGRDRSGTRHHSYRKAQAMISRTRWRPPPKSRPHAESAARHSSLLKPNEAISREPALSATITRKLGRVVPANLQIDARWDAIRDAREAAKKSDGKNAPSPSVMVAWTVVRAMEKHAAFRA